jgi:hypothetical protein
MMRKLLISIVIIFCTLRVFATDYYVATNGNNGNTGLNGSPWLTAAYAVATATSEGDIIHFGSGTFSCSTKLELADGVSIVGSGIDNTILNLTYTEGSCLALESWGYWGNTNYGNQSISYMTIDGDMTGYRAIKVLARCNVKLHHLKIIDFTTEGIVLIGQDETTFTADNPYSNKTKGEPDNCDYAVMPSYWATGNEVYDCEIINCSGYSGTRDNGEGKGLIRIGSQDGIKVYNCALIQLGRGVGLNGYAIKFGDLGFNKHSDIHDNFAHTETTPNSNWGFAIEWWNGLGGDRFYNNRIIGAFDLVNMVDAVGAGYSVDIDRNDIGYDEIQGQQEVGIDIEGRIEHLIIRRNKIRKVAIALYRPLHNYTGYDQMSYTTIEINLLMDLGRSDADFQTWGFYYPDNYVDQASSVYNYIRHNTIIADPNRTTVSRWGLELSASMSNQHWWIENNIIVGFDGAAIHALGSRTLFDDLYIRNNLCYGNGNNNAPEWVDGFVPTNYTNSGNILGQNPLLTSLTDYTLSSTSSPAYHAGISTSTTTDYAGNAYFSSPSIGAYEYIEEIINPSLKYGRYKGTFGRYRGTFGKY